MHARDATVEGVIGVVVSKDGINRDEEERTDPARARECAEPTGVDAQAVAVGTRHPMESQDAKIDLHLIDVPRDVVAVPVVLHATLRRLFSAV